MSAIKTININDKIDIYLKHRFSGNANSIYSTVNLVNKIIEWPIYFCDSFPSLKNRVKKLDTIHLNYVGEKISSTVIDKNWLLNVKEKLLYISKLEVFANILNVKKNIENLKIMTIGYIEIWHANESSFKRLLIKINRILIVIKDVVTTYIDILFFLEMNYIFSFSKRFNKYYNFIRKFLDLVLNLYYLIIMIPEIADNFYKTEDLFPRIDIPNFYLNKFQKKERRIKIIKILIKNIVNIIELVNIGLSNYISLMHPLFYLLITSLEYFICDMHEKSKVTCSHIIDKNNSIEKRFDLINIPSQFNLICSPSIDYINVMINEITRSIDNNSKDKDTDEHIY